MSDTWYRDPLDLPPYGIQVAGPVDEGSYDPEGRWLEKALAATLKEINSKFLPMFGETAAGMETVVDKSPLRTEPPAVANLESDLAEAMMGMYERIAFGNGSYVEVDPLNPWARCPCGHMWMAHDVDEYSGDGSETCCVDGCAQAGCPGHQSRCRWCGEAIAPTGHDDRWSDQARRLNCASGARAHHPTR